MKQAAISFLKTLIRGSSLPCFIVSEEPFIVISYWFDFVKERDAIRAAIPKETVCHFLFQLGWHVETPERLAEILKDASDLGENHTFLANSEAERDLLLSGGLNAIYCHQNAFVDEDFYPLQKHRTPNFDALYLARITPFKRHHLAAKIPSLKLIGAYSEAETEYRNKVVSEHLSHADCTEKVRGSDVHRYMSDAHVGLCLSAEEGAMFVSVEYLLCGTPLVSTENLGGRAGLFDESCCLIVDDTPEAVAAGVEEMKARSLKPEEVREITLAKMRPFR